MATQFEQLMTQLGEMKQDHAARFTDLANKLNAVSDSQIQHIEMLSGIKARTGKVEQTLYGNGNPDRGICTRLQSTEIKQTACLASQRSIHDRAWRLLGPVVLALIAIGSVTWIQKQIAPSMPPATEAVANAVTQAVSDAVSAAASEAVTQAVENAEVNNP